MTLPFKYRGMTIGGNPSTVSFWKPINEKKPSVDCLDGRGDYYL